MRITENREQKAAKLITDRCGIHAVIAKELQQNDDNK